jgi:hypothetical protein
MLVLAQCIGAFGYPVVVRDDETVRRCGCKVKGPSATCCCGTGSCCGGVAGQEIPEPEQPTCPKCKVKQAVKAAPPTITLSAIWLSSISARPCHGDSPHGFLAEFPTIPPSWDAPAIAAPLPSDRISLGDDESSSHSSIPPDPPPRRG